MSDNELRPMALDDVLSFNDELLTLARTGLPFELEAGDNYERLAQKLTQANAKLALDVGRGRQLDDALADVPELTSHYRAALETWFRCDRSIEAFESLTSPAEGRRQIRSDVGYSFIQPLILLFLVYCGFTFLVLATAPALELMYAQMMQTPGHAQQTPGYGLQMLTAARRFQPFWGPTVPLLFIAGIALWRSRAGYWEFRWLPWRAQALASIRKANYAESVASLVDKDYSLAQSLTLLGPLRDETTDGKAYAAATERLIQAEQLQEQLTVQDAALKPLPPMLRWAFTSGLAGQPLANTLRFAARMYRQTARRKLTFWRIWLPIALGAGIGGLLVLMFGLSLFLPMVELLKSLSRP